MSAACPILGFRLELALDPQLSDAECEALLHVLMTFLHQRGLEADGVASRHHWRYRIRGESAQATDTDRLAMTEWASLQRAIRACRVSDVYDLEAV